MGTRRLPRILGKTDDERRVNKTNTIIHNEREREKIKKKTRRANKVARKARRINRMNQ